MKQFILIFSLLLTFNSCTDITHSEYATYQVVGFYTTKIGCIYEIERITIKNDKSISDIINDEHLIYTFNIQADCNKFKVLEIIEFGFTTVTTSANKTTKEFEIINNINIDNNNNVGNNAQNNLISKFLKNERYNIIESKTCD